MFDLYFQNIPAFGNPDSFYISAHYLYYKSLHTYWHALPDTVILTLACGKFRLNDLDLGTVAGLPRILDVGQCNDAYSAIRIALALADAFGCTVNDLPLSLVLCWFEQKAVCILIALLALGIRNIRLGPTLPAFLSPGVVRVLQEKYNLMAVTTPEDDLKAILNNA